MSSVARHVLVLSALVVLLAVAMLLPFLPGSYDPLAFTVSLSAQLIGVLGLLLVPLGAIGIALRHRRGRPVLAGAATAWAGLVAVLLGLGTILAGSLSFGVLTLAVSVFAVIRLRKAGAAPVYLVVVPPIALLLQWVLAAPATEFSRRRAIAASAEMIADIEAYRAEHGTYPESMVAINLDYHSSVVGIERFEYARRGDGYDLCFQQPRFLLDDLGAREVLVYNPRDEHRIMSHAAWNLVWAPGEEDIQQGWFSVREMDSPHWKSFSFD